MSISLIFNKSGILFCRFSASHKSIVLSEMKFFMWYDTYAIYGSRETLILLKPMINSSSIEIFSYNWSIDEFTMEECLQEWNTKVFNHLSIKKNSTFFLFPRKNVIMMLYMFEFYQIVQQWMSFVLTHIDQ